MTGHSALLLDCTHTCTCKCMYSHARAFYMTCVIHKCTGTCTCYMLHAPVTVIINIQTLCVIILNIDVFQQVLKSALLEFTEVAKGNFTEQDLTRAK